MSQRLEDYLKALQSATRNVTEAIGSANAEENHKGNLAGYEKLFDVSQWDCPKQKALASALLDYARNNIVYVDGIAESVDTDGIGREIHHYSFEFGDFEITGAGYVSHSNGDGYVLDEISLYTPSLRDTFKDTYSEDVWQGMEKKLEAGFQDLLADSICGGEGLMDVGGTMLLPDQEALINQFQQDWGKVA